MKTNLYTFLALFLFLSFTSINAQTLTVNNNADTSDAVAGDGVCDDGSGNCTLRAAIEEANANNAITQIHFSAAMIISPVTELPIITRPNVVIDGTTAPTASCGVLTNNTLHNLVVEIIGGGATFNGLTVNAQNVIIRGLVIRGFDGNAFVSGVRVNQDNVTIECCYLGTNASGNTADGNSRGVYTSSSRSNITIQNSLISGNTVAGVQPGLAASVIVKGNLIGTDETGIAALPNDIGVYLLGTSGSTIGGTSNTERNIISGNTQSGIEAGPIGSIGTTTIQGNYIGTDINGTAALANGAHGIDMGNGGFNYIIGGDSMGEGNVISGNTLYGIDVNNGVMIQGNIIGADNSGFSGIPNQAGGILINTGKSDISIGGDNIEDGNIIAFNQGVGIEINSAAGLNNPIRKNQIYSNTGLGIDINADGPTDNDELDVDEGANNVQNSPLIYNSYVSGNEVTVTFLVNTDVANAVYPLNVDFYKADVSGEEGETYLGTISYAVAEALLYKTASFTTAAVVNIGEFILATATDSNGNTSEFSTQSILPVELVNFNVIEKDQTALLQWTTASEINNKGFEIEHKHLNDWEKIGFIEGKENSELENHYSFQTKKLQSGFHYFRLKQIDLDGAFEYSDIVNIKVKNAYSLVEIYPNPVANLVYLECEASQNARSTVSIFNLEGSLIKQYSFELDKGYNQNYLDLNDLASGQYVVNWNIEGEQIVRMLMKE